MQGTARTLFCVVVAVSTLVWLVALDIANLAAGSPLALMLLVPATIAAGLTFGASWTLMSVITSELFGLKNFSFNYSAVQLAPILATSVCPLAVGKLFDRAAELQHPEQQQGNIPCTGHACFGAGFGIMTALSAVVRLSPLYVVHRLTLLTSLHGTCAGSLLQRSIWCRHACQWRQGTMYCEGAVAAVTW